MPDIPPADPDKQLEAWRRAVDALGGQHDTARLLEMSPRSVSRLYRGSYALHDGILRDTATALLEHAKLCHALERQLTPTRHANLTERQRTQNRRGLVKPGQGSKAGG